MLRVEAGNNCVNIQAKGRGINALMYNYATRRVFTDFYHLNHKNNQDSEPISVSFMAGKLQGGHGLSRSVIVLSLNNNMRYFQFDNINTRKR